MSKKQRWIAAIVAVVVVAGGLLLSTQTDLLQGKLRLNWKNLDKVEHQNVPNIDIEDLKRPKIPSLSYYDVPVPTTQGGGTVDGLTRCELAKMLVDGADLTGSVRISFSDIASDSWCHPYVSTVVANGVMNGYPDGNFGGSNSVLRAELIKMVVEAFDIPVMEYSGSMPSDVDEGVWYEVYVGTLLYWDVLPVSRALKPAMEATEAYAETLIDNAADGQPFGIKPAYDTTKWPAKR
jgi:hypothetical protein